jgi:hypothetical protein
MAKLEVVLEQRGIASAREMSEALARCQLHGGDLTTSLLQFVSADEAALSAAVSECYGLPAVNVGLLAAPDEDALHLLPREVAERYCCFPIDANTTRLVLAVAHPLAPALKEELSFALGVNIEERVALEVRIRQAISRYYGLPLSARNQRGIARLDGDIDSAPLETPLGIWSDTLAALPRPPSEGPSAERVSRPADERRPGRSASQRPALASPPSSGLRTTRRRGPFSLERAREELARVTTRNEALETFFSFASQFFEYSALFGVHSSLAEGLDAAGPGAAREIVQGIGVPLDLPSSLSEASESCKLRLTRLGRDGIDRTLASDLRRPCSARVLILPICLRGRCAVLLFGDNGESDVNEHDTADVVAIGPDVANALGRIILARKRETLAQRASIDPAVSQSLAPSRLAPSERPSGRARAKLRDSERAGNSVVPVPEFASLPARNIDKSRNNGRSGSKPNASPAPLAPHSLPADPDARELREPAVPTDPRLPSVNLAAGDSAAGDSAAGDSAAGGLSPAAPEPGAPEPASSLSSAVASAPSGAATATAVTATAAQHLGASGEDEDGTAPILLDRPPLEDPVFLLARPRGMTPPPPAPSPPAASRLADDVTARPPEASMPVGAWFAEPAPARATSTQPTVKAPPPAAPPPRAPFEPAPPEPQMPRVVPKPQVTITLPRTVMTQTRLPSVIVDRQSEQSNARSAATRPPAHARPAAARPRAEGPEPAASPKLSMPGPSIAGRNSRTGGTQPGLASPPAAAREERIVGRAPISLTAKEPDPSASKRAGGSIKPTAQLSPTLPAAAQRRLSSPRAPAVTANAHEAVTAVAPQVAPAAPAASPDPPPPAAKADPAPATAIPTETRPAEPQTAEAAPAAATPAEPAPAAPPPPATSGEADAKAVNASSPVPAESSARPGLSAANAPPPVMPFSRSPSVHPPAVSARPLVTPISDEVADAPVTRSERVTAEPEATSETRHAVPPPAASLDEGAESMPAPAARVTDPAPGSSVPPPTEDIEQLIDALCQGHQEAGHDLARLGTAPLPQLMARFPGPVISERAGPSSRASECGPLLQALAGIGSPATPDITRRSEDVDARVRRWATLLLGELPSPEACRAVVQRLADDVPRVHQAALDAARLLLSSSAANLFRKTLFEVAETEDAPLTLRLRTLEHVAKLRDSASVPRLIAFLGADTEPIVHKALWALTVVTRQDFGRDAQRWSDWWHAHQAQHRVEWLIEALDHPEHRLRKSAIDELRVEVNGDFGYSENHTPSERQQAQERYRQWWENTGARRFGRLT